MKTVFRSRIFNVVKKTVKIRGRSKTFDIIKSSNTVVILPLLNDGRIVLERHYRVAAGRYIYELPAGYMERGETPEFAARRELKEETGYVPRRMKLMFSAYVTPGSKTEMANHFYATGLRKSSSNLEEDEQLSVILVTKKQAISMIKTNKIRDYKTIANLLYYFRFIEKG